MAVRDYNAIISGSTYGYILVTPIDPASGQALTGLVPADLTALWQLVPPGNTVAFAPSAGGTTVDPAQHSSTLVSALYSGTPASGSGDWIDLGVGSYYMNAPAAVRSYDPFAALEVDHVKGVVTLTRVADGAVLAFGEFMIVAADANVADNLSYHPTNTDDLASAAYDIMMTATAVAAVPENVWNYELAGVAPSGGIVSLNPPAQNVVLAAQSSAGNAAAYAATAAGVLTDIKIVGFDPAQPSTYGHWQATTPAGGTITGTFLNSAGQPTTDASQITQITLE